MRCPVSYYRVEGIFDFVNRHSDKFPNATVLISQSCMEEIAIIMIKLNNP